MGGIELDGNTASADRISGGGFSNYFSQPSYQTNAVGTYLKAHSSTPSPKAYNASGRAYPDIASFSEDVVIVTGGYETYVAGTSCAAPVVSGTLSLSIVSCTHVIY